MEAAMSRRAGILVLASLLSLASPATAAQLKTYELGAFAGAYFGDAGAGVEDDVIYGVRGGISFTRIHQLELSADRVETTFRSPSFGRLDEEFTSIGLNWTLNFPLPRNPFVPYLSFGLGEIEDEVTLPDGTVSDDDDTYFSFAGGFRVFINETFAVRLDARFKDYDTFDVGQNSWDLTVGATWVFGRRR
jgi:hypothetical protein